MPVPETPLSLLGSVRELGDAELPRLYAYPDGTWVRANFITSVDGGATAGGSSGTMGGPGDRLVFNLLRELADVIVVGAGTVRVEGYSGAQVSVAQRQRRQTRGQSEVPQLAIVTKSGRLDRDMGIFTRTEVPPLVLTCSAAVAPARQLLGDLCEVVDCSGGDPAQLDEAVMLAILGDRGMRRILTEGGPMLLDSLIRRDMLDELCLTIAPYIVGGLARRIATGPSQLLTRMRCAHVLTDDAGYLYTRYVKA
ncbi:pyrimidine reductase family protein [Mycobacterium sp. SMC-2]|uniref:pyrimidine reductase family protein n=1 Tax=Mycobacterium sp. SMC-2 TaxID=2857058 RepID=UPI0021B1CD80|nr:pyrimidine reductase family protein [Mycobacterium sp. SMC-2]UXA08862.1 pyrimidine reductase family protein [Mycobacterium sp. SMC-2]